MRIIERFILKLHKLFILKKIKGVLFLDKSAQKVDLFKKNCIIERNGGEKMEEIKNDITSYMIHKQELSGKTHWAVYVWRGEKVDDVMICEDEYSVADIISTYAHEHDAEWHNFIKEREEAKKEEINGSDNQ